MTTPTHDERIESLEIKLAHLERALQDLGDVVYRQQQQLDAAEAKHQRLLDRLASDEAAAAPASPFEIPPHY